MQSCKNYDIMNKIRSLEAFFLITYKKGQCFFTHKQDKHITAIANYYEVKVKTERYIGIDCLYHTEIINLTKVTIL